MNPPIVDVHCHTFNADDLPVRGFIQHVGLRDSSLGSSLAQLVDVLIQHGAPGYQDEKPTLDALLAQQDFESTFELAAPAPTVNLRGQLDREVDEALLDLQARNPGLVRRVGRDIAISDGTIDAASEEAAFEGFTDVIAFARRGVRWVKLVSKSRIDIAGLLISTFKDQVDLFCPMLVDMGASLGDVPKTTIHEQVILQEKISRLSMQGRLPGGGKARMHPFIGFDPRNEAKARAARDLRTPLDLVKESVEDYGFVGVKLYPPMGWRPIGNVPVGDMTSAEASLIDQVLLELYKWCEEQQVPITAHCNDSNYADAAYQRAGLAGPDGWIEVLERFPELRLNLGHFGGARKTEEPEGWPWKIGRAARRFPHVYADVGNHNIDDQELALGYLETLHSMFEHGDSSEMAHRVMYGSDWYMVALHPDHEAFLETYRQLYEERFGPERTTAFLGGTALRFLGFDDPSNRNAQRLRNRYERFAPDRIPGWLS